VVATEKLFSKYVEWGDRANGGQTEKKRNTERGNKKKPESSAILRGKKRRKSHEIDEEKNSEFTGRG